MKRCYTGGAPLGPDVFQFFHSIGVNLKQIYGQTEICGIAVVHRDDDISYTSVGTPIPGTEIRFSADHEIMLRSSSVFRGYHRNPEATAEAVDTDGWLHTSDAGYLDEHGHLVVVDRLKDVKFADDSTMFSNAFIENKLKFSPYVEESVGLHRLACGGPPPSSPLIPPPWVHGPSMRICPTPPIRISPPSPRSTTSSQKRSRPPTKISCEAHPRQPIRSAPQAVRPGRRRDHSDSQSPALRHRTRAMPRSSTHWSAEPEERHDRIDGHLPGRARLRARSRCGSSTSPLTRCPPAARRQGWSGRK